MWTPRAPSYLRPRRSWRAPAELLNFGLFFVCAVLLVMSRISHGIVIDARDWLVDMTAPVLEAASIPAIQARHVVARARSYAGLFGEIDRLTVENAGLKQYEWRAKTAERKVTQLRALLNAVDEPALHYITGSVIADARGPFMRSALINLGRDHGLRVGYAVINGDGLIGRTVDAGASVARVLLLNDLNSRIPVLAAPPAFARSRSATTAPNSSSSSSPMVLCSKSATRSIRRGAMACCRGACTWAWSPAPTVPTKCARMPI